MIETKIWLIDNYVEIVYGKPVTHVFAYAEDGSLLHLLEKNHKPFLYATSYNTNNLDMSRVIKINEVIKTYKRKDIKVYKIITKTPNDVPQLKKQIEDDGFKTYEADMYYHWRWRLDTRILACRWSGVKIKPYSNLHKSDFYEPTGEIVSSWEIKEFDINTPVLHFLVFDIESANKQIISLGFGCSQCKKFTQVIDIEEFPEQDIIKLFTEIIHIHDPDIINTYYGSAGSDSFDIPYIMERAEFHNLELNWGRDGSTVHFIERGKKIKINGRILVDDHSYVLTARIKGHDGSTKLKSVYRKLFKKEPIELNTANIGTLMKFIEGRQLIREYNLSDINITMEMSIAANGMTTAFSTVSNMLPSSLLDSGKNVFCENIISVYASRLNEIIPNKVKNIKDRPFVGATGVAPPSPDHPLYRTIYELMSYWDFESLYPNMIIDKNIGFDSYCEDGSGDIKLYLGGEQFKGEPWRTFTSKFKSIWAIIEEDLLNRRRVIKKKLIIGDELSYDFWYQKALKEGMNSLYGLFAEPYFRWFNIDIAESITGFARDALRESIVEAESIPLSVIYGDTDSNFIWCGEFTKSCNFVCPKCKTISTKLNTNTQHREFPESGILDCKKCGKIEVACKCPQYCNFLTESFGGFLKMDDFFESVFFNIGKKKTRLALRPDGSEEIKGIAAKRSNYPDLIRDAQKDTIKTFLRTRNKDEMIRTIQSYILKLVNLEFNISEVTIRIGFDEDYVYKNETITTKLAKKYKLQSGKIPFVILHGEGILRDRAEYAPMVKDKTKIDLGYYLESLDKVTGIITAPLNISFVKIYNELFLNSMVVSFDETKESLDDVLEHERINKIDKSRTRFDK